MYKLSNIKYMHEGFRALGQHPDGRIFISRPNGEGVLYSMNANGVIEKSYYNFIRDAGFTSGINQILILNSGIMLVTGPTATNQVVMRSTDTTYTNFTKVMELTPHSYVYDRGWSTNADDSLILISEYSVADRDLVPVANVYKSTDGGQTFNIAHQFSRKIYDTDWIRHIHFVQYDKYDDNFVIGVGDSNDEAKLYRTQNGSDLELLGGGSQTWRAVSVEFTEDYIYWGMDGHAEGEGATGAYMYRLKKSDLTYDQVGKSHALMYIIQSADINSQKVFLINNAQETHNNFLDKRLDDRVHLYALGKEGEFVDTHSWRRNEDSPLYSRMDNVIDLGNGKVLFSARAIMGEDGKKYSYVLFTAEIKETVEPVLKIITSELTETLPLLTFDKVIDNRLKVFINSVTRYLELVEVGDENASGMKLKIGDSLKSIKKI